MKLTYPAILAFVAILASPSAHSFFGSEDAPGYDRSSFPHWLTVNHYQLEDGTICRASTRVELLKKKGKHVALARNDRGECIVTVGEWEDYYSGETIKNARDIDVDHVVSLKDAWNSGAHGWDRRRREAFANATGGLVITTASFNRSKGEQGIGSWLPADKDRACKYINLYTRIKRESRLTFTEDEIDTIEDFHGEDVETARGSEYECHIKGAFKSTLFSQEVLLNVRE